MPIMGMGVIRMVLPSEAAAFTVDTAIWLAAPTLFSTSTVRA